MLTAFRRAIVRNPHLCVVAAVALGAALVPILADRRDGDDWTTIAYVQEFLLEDGNVRDPFFGTDMIIDPRYLVSAWPRVLAGISELTGIGPVMLVRELLPPVLIVLAVLVAFAFYSGIERRDRWVVSMAVVLFVLYFVTTAAKSTERQGEAFFIRLAQDKLLVSLVMVPLAAAFLARVVANGSLLATAGAAIVAVAAANVHAFATVLLAFVTVPLIVACLLGRELSDRFRRSSMVLLVVAIAIVPAIMQFWLARALEANEFFTATTLNAPSMTGLSLEEAHVAELAGRRYDRLAWGLAVANRGFVVHGMAVLAGALFPLVALGWRRDFAARYSVLLFAMVLAVLYVPPLTRGAIAVLTPSQAWRVSWLLPYATAPIIAIGAREVYCLLRARRRRKRLAWAAPLLLIAAAVVPGLVFSARWVSKEGPPELYLAPTASEVQVIKLINGVADAGGDERPVVLASRFTSRFIPSYAPRARVVDFRDAALAFTPERPDSWHRRRTDVKGFFAQTEANAAVSYILLRYSVDLVITEKAAFLDEAFGQCPTLFRKVGESADHTLYSVRKKALYSQPEACSQN